MQAGLATKRLSFREVFMAVPERILFVIIIIYVTVDLDRVREQRLAA
jgi:phage-related holin